MFTFWLTTFLLLQVNEPLSVNVDITIAMVGDIMMGSDYPSSRLPPNGGVDVFKDAGKYLAQADLAIGNLEGPITAAQTCAKKVVEGKTYAFRTPPEFAELLTAAGVDILTTANNHSGDFGSQGRIDTGNILDSLGIKYTGPLEKYAIVEVKGIKVGVIGYSPYKGDNPLLDLIKAKSQVAELKNQVDIVVVTFHGGAEGDKFIHLTDGMEKYLGEDRGELKTFTHAMIDAGADVVFGHGPHVPRAMEIYQDKFIAYSLGNFATYYGVSVNGKGGLAPLVLLTIDKSGKAKDLQVVSFSQQKTHLPVLDTTHEAAKLMITLSQEDFGSTHPLIENCIK